MSIGKHAFNLSLCSFLSVLKPSGTSASQSEQLTNFFFTSEMGYNGTEDTFQNRF